MSLPEQIPDIAAFLRKQGISGRPEAAIILGSGLGGFSERIEDPITISYGEIPHFPQTSVKGHEGSLIRGTIEGKNIIAFSGRFHHYEGYDFETTALPVYLAKALGTNKLIISNAAGAINTTFDIGDLMIIDDIIRQNLAIAPYGHRRYRYNHYRWTDRVEEIAQKAELDVRRGSYLYAKGPNYETKAEIRAFRTLGADVVGMSTAPELMEASRLGLKSAAISLITNMASGVLPGKLDHEEVKEAAQSRKEDFAKLVKKLVAEF